MKPAKKLICPLFVALTYGNITGQNSCNTFSTFFGGNQSDEIKSICIDGAKNNYIIGNTYSADLPVTPGLINDTYSGGYDAFISKFDSCGALIWSTYMGGSNFESAEKMIITATGDVVLCGYTNSLNTFTSTGCFQSTLVGSYDCFITKINPLGHIVWSTYFGKSGGDFAFDIHEDKQQNIIIGGTTTSTNLYTTSSSFQPNHNGNTDAFIAKLSSNGQLKWCTYYGGTGSEDIHEITTDLHSNIIAAGGSFSTNLNTSAGAHQNINKGSSDGYIIKLDSTGARVFSSYIGGSAIDDVWGIACDANATIYLAGHTSSTDFDTTTNAYQTLNKGLSDLYLTKWSATGSLLKSTLFGGSATDNLARMILSSAYELTLIGKTESMDIPMLGTGTQQVLGGNYDMLIAKFNAVTLTPVWTSYYGGTMNDEAFDIVSFNDSFFEFAGVSNSINYPVSTSAYQQVLNNSLDGVISKLNVGNLVPLSLNSKKTLNSVSVFPNPFKNTLTIITEDFVMVSIYSVMGEELYSIGKTNNPLILNTESLANGTYIIVVSTKAETTRFKLIK